MKVLHTVRTGQMTHNNSPSIVTRLACKLQSETTMNCRPHRYREHGSNQIHVETDPDFEPRVPFNDTVTLIEAHS